VHDLGEMCPYTHSENCADIHVQMQIKHKRRIQINFNGPYEWHNPLMLIYKKIKIYIYIYYIIACLLLSLTVEENWKLQEKWDKVSIRNDHILPHFRIRLVIKMQNLYTALSFRLIRDWPQLCLKEVHCRHLPMRTEVSASYTSILDCNAQTGYADHLRT
jgi:hypothetical protein